MDALDECAKLERAEQIVSEEVRTYLQTNTKDMEDEIMMWTSQYNEEIERREQEINELKVNILEGDILKGGSIFSFLGTNRK